MHDVIIIGSGMGSLSAAALLVKKGLKPLIIEQNWIPGGCTTSYWRKGFVFEAGATTLVGLDKHMPLRYLLDETGIEVPVRKLKLPMQVHMAGGITINKYESIEQWITEAEKHFDGNQRYFWEKSYQLSQFVWKASTKYKQFPPATFKDYLSLARSANPLDILPATYALKNTESILKKSNLLQEDFKQYINEQLLITAQNPASEVNFLFGAAALCYTNYGNYYVDGGLINLIKPIVEYIESNGGKIVYRNGVQEISKNSGGYTVKTKNDSYQTKYLVSGIPLNNLHAILSDSFPKLKGQILQSDKLYSAFQMGIGFKSDKHFESIHHQIHLENPLPETGSKSIFLSLNHEEDLTRFDTPGTRVASISTHIRDPKNSIIDVNKTEAAVVDILEKRGFLNKEDIIYAHSSGPKSWAKWTGRAFGFVGGYPQYSHIKPWQMNEARVDGDKAYQCGDTAYPGQGIPGATLSGIIAAEKLSSDWL